MATSESMCLLLSVNPGMDNFVQSPAWSGGTPFL